MKNTKKIFFVLALPVLLGVAAWKIFYGTSASDTRRQSTPQVNVEQPRRDTVVYRLRFTGDIAAIQQAGIFSRVSGNLDRIYVDIGTQVQQGQILALVDTTELAQQFQQASATYQNSKLNYERNKELVEQNLIAKQELDNSEATMKVTKAAFEAASTRLGYARITAPFRGFITKRFLDQGANVSSNNTTLFTLMDIDEVKVIVNILEKDIPRISIGKEATVSVDAFPGETFTGTIRRLSEAVDLSTRTMAIEIDIPNPAKKLKPGMFANVTLVVEEHPDVLTLPTQTILKDEQGSFVFIVSNSKAKKKPVKVGAEQNNRMEIISGLEGDEAVIVMGQQFVKDGVQVNVQK